MKSLQEDTLHTIPPTMMAVMAWNYLSDPARVWPVRVSPWGYALKLGEGAHH